MQHQQNHTPAAPLVSFIVAYYDLPPQLLRQCVDSILALALETSERQLIIIDDGSPNSPLESISDYLDEVVYIRQQNGGLSEARNTGLRIAEGEYIQFVDADDYLLKHPYEQCLDLMRTQHPDVVMFDFTTIDRNTEQGADIKLQTPTSGAEYMAHNNLRSTACGYLFRRSILGGLRFTPGIYHEDEEFTPQLLLRAESICSTDTKAYYYRQRPQSITSATDVRTTLRRLGDCRLVISKLANLADKLPVAERQALQRRVAQLTMDYIYNVIVQTKSQHYLDRKLSSLQREGLFPLPDRDYTLKYQWFRRLTNSSMGRALLLRVLPKMSKER